MGLPSVRIWPALLRDIIVTILTGILLVGGLLYLRWLMDHGAVRWLTIDDFHLLEAGAIAVIGYLFARSIGAALNRLMESEGNVRHSALVRLVVNGLIAIAVLLALFSVGGVSVQNLFFGSALVGIILGLASQTVLGNVFAGLVIILVGPFKVHERVAIISSEYGAIWPTYPHELMYPTYTGVVEEIGLFYTVLQLESGRTARIPNSVVLSALVVSLHPGHLRSQRVRMTFSLATPVSVLEAAVPEVARTISASGPDIPPPHAEVQDIGKETWDGVLVLWTMEPSEEKVRDIVLRAVLPNLKAVVLPENSATPGSTVTATFMAGAGPAQGAKKP